MPPGDPVNGLITVTLPLPPGIVAGWLTSDTNHGLLMRSDNGTIALILSQNTRWPLLRPLLEVVYTY